MATSFPYTIKDVVNICGIELGRRQSGSWVDAKCPYYPAKEIRVNLESDSISCFHQCSGCPHHPEPGQAGMLDLYCLARGISDKKQANREIREALFGKAAPPKEAFERRATMEEKDVEPPIASIEARDKAYKALLFLCPLTKAHKRDLLERGLTEADIREGGYKSVPQSGLANICRTLQRMGCNLDGVPGFYKSESTGTMSMAVCKPGYFIPYFDQNGLIQGLQIRYDVKITADMTPDEVKEAKQKRYRWFTSGIKKPGKVGAAAKNWSYYGRPGSLRRQEANKEFAVYVTEGGLKANVASVLCNRVYGKDRAFVAIPGVSCYTTWAELLKGLKNAGVTTVVDAFDSDRASNESVNNAVERLMDMARQYGFKVIPWNWGTEQKGCDDFLLSKLKQKVVA